MGNPHADSGRFSRLSRAIAKRYWAAKWGVFFGASEAFTLPTSIKLGGKRIQTSLPSEHGVKVAFMELLLGDCYGLRSVKPAPRTVLDIGANVGLFTIAARQAFPKALIHAYEPNRNLERHLKVQAGAANATYFMEAVGREDGKVSMHLAEDSVCSTSELSAIGDVPAIAFRKAIERLGGTVDFAKVDCEGAEWEFLADVEAWRRVGRLAMEYHIVEGHTHEDAARAMDRIGFRISEIRESPTFGVLQAIRV